MLALISRLQRLLSTQDQMHRQNALSSESEWAEYNSRNQEIAALFEAFIARTEGKGSVTSARASSSNENLISK